MHSRLFTGGNTNSKIVANEYHINDAKTVSKYRKTLYSDNNQIMNAMQWLTVQLLQQLICGCVLAKLPICKQTNICVLPYRMEMCVVFFLFYYFSFYFSYASMVLSAFRSWFSLEPLLQNPLCFRLEQCYDAEYNGHCLFGKLTGNVQQINVIENHTYELKMAPATKKTWNIFWKRKKKLWMMSISVRHWRHTKHTHIHTHVKMHVQITLTRISSVQTN